jgi:hypothetical protein
MSAAAEVAAQFARWSPGGGLSGKLVSTLPVPTDSQASRWQQARQHGMAGAPPSRGSGALMRHSGRKLPCRVDAGLRVLRARDGQHGAGMPALLEYGHPREECGMRGATRPPCRVLNPAVEAEMVGR